MRIVELCREEPLVARVARVARVVVYLHTRLGGSKKCNYYQVPSSNMPIYGLAVTGLSLAYDTLSHSSLSHTSLPHTAVSDLLSPTHTHPLDLNFFF